ncbi:hypothetical protein SERLA73DRAFT_180832 [Serpula lacrymans var. lacrymans S7.3]|uniref:Fungal lipase-type domain-containing protein n=2 Tax=Serpula lacrymans var. lacrymans TaxID=341189 RepID=F8PWI7_SERL3|nr:uncharacterized protein SERLADRAFT_466609 [Serpula lacrymans var. lacrymans S7.9]EGO00311.1 hypothetical protein SERLA73DRAFT_180832 [Serpula lacrymans var. lacrymans S7.3]EGO25869.1 hypothetical protein SERLADRAFT_466609 [Serpula lacrymans var. lacrymans S7.9]
MSPSIELSPEQRHMYASERLINFRWISKILATRSPRILNDDDLTSPDLHLELATLGQFSELVYCPFPLEFAFNNLALLLSPGFPLEGYDALNTSDFVRSFHGSVANLSGFIVRRQKTEQLVVAISGTSSIWQAAYTIRAHQVAHSVGSGCKVHSGFWSLYLGIRSQVFDAIRESLEGHIIGELVITGHSMGGAMSYLLAFDILNSDEIQITRGLKLKIVTFGAPRCGNEALVQCWRSLVDGCRTEYGRGSVQEYCVKGYNDGVPSLPPLKLGYRHFSQNPLYYVHGRLYHIPESESECALFDSHSEIKDIPTHPRGGHNYYNGRDMEKAARRMWWLKEVHKEEGWEQLYRKRMEQEQKRKI